MIPGIVRQAQQVLSAWLPDRHALRPRVDRMFYHASPVKGLAQLEPRISNQDIPLVYFSRKRENVLACLSNAVEKYCRETDR